MSKTLREEILKEYERVKDPEDLKISNIERVGAISDVVELLSKGHTYNDVLVKLRAQYPNQKFDRQDLELFITRHQEISKEVLKEDKKLRLEHAEAELKLKEQIIEMQQMVLDSMKQAQHEKNFTGVASLHNSMLSSIKLIAQMDGALKEGGESKEAAKTDVEQENSGARSYLLEAAAAAEKTVKK